MDSIIQHLTGYPAQVHYAVDLIKNQGFSYLQKHYKLLSDYNEQHTVEMPIGDSLLPDGPVYRKGCYIFLTGDDIAEESQISWGDYDE